ncbi:ADP-ribosylglycohydrolase family protein [Hymenobacter sp. BT683]|uniref:ADP-ribosylglycohydrolase family protein n=1 Tax=Hymenobacter jeongseonensis TaxID=2791027 RepID=A0ABS0IJ77_9BACT|nr:ADP-ribosylglycohydrolase family protein [Hymenobacter jeongseonensis]MBF9238391.1 ADP-ribosylglycohydrolase family protein [Hymenobacter jeongseonensis]
MSQPLPSLESQLRSALLGLAVGDALGVPVEFQSRAVRRRDPVTGMRAYGTHHQPAGTWSDDASLTFCLAEALADGYSVRRLADHCARWYQDAFWTPHGRVFDIGITTREALQRLQNLPQEASPLVGGRDEMSNGNGALMRVLPLAFYQAQAPLAVRFRRIADAAAVTHGHLRSALACFLYLELAAHLRAGLTPAVAYARLCEDAPAQFEELQLPAGEAALFARFLGGQLASVPEAAIASSGYVLHTLEAAVWCLLRHATYAETVLAAVNLGDDTDTTGAVAGGLAGLCYGEGGIPVEWHGALARRADIEDLAHRAAVGCVAVQVAPPRPIPNSYWATPSVLGCEYPGDRTAALAQAKLKALLDVGITDFFDLTEAHELTPYEPWLQELADQQGIVVRYQRYPIRDVDVPTPAVLEEALAALADSVAAGRKAAVHCWGGVGRTGTVLGCYLVRAHQVSGAEALASIAREWQGVEKSHRVPQSPETAAQCRLVECFE